MPLTEKGEEIMRKMQRTYGPEKGEEVFYASKNAGTIKGVEAGDNAPYQGTQSDVFDDEKALDEFDLLLSAEKAKVAGLQS